MGTEEALELAQSLVFDKTNKHLDQLQIAVLRGAWENQTYEQIAERYSFSSAHAKSVGANLWELLSDVFGTKVNKKNFQVVLERRMRVGEHLKAEAIEQPQRNSLFSLFNHPFPEPELPGGQVPLDSSFYVERPTAEERLYKAILQPGSLIRIQASKQMGKTSLMTRGLDQARQQGYHTVNLSFQLAERNVFTDLNRFLKWFCASVSKSLGLPNQLSRYWDDALGSNYSSTDYFENYLLAQIDSPVVIGLDEVEVIFQYPEVASDFLSLLRAWYEKSRSGSRGSDVWKKLRLVVVHSPEVHLPLNVSQSPFNVGLSIELPQLTSQQVLNLAQHHGLYWNIYQVQQLMSLVGGYPYLVKLGLYHIWHQDVTLEQLLFTAATKGGIYREHLHQQLWNLQQSPELCSAFAQVVNASKPMELELVQALKLHSMGLVHLQGNQVRLSCNLYHQFFKAILTDKEEISPQLKKVNQQKANLLLQYPVNRDELTQLANRDYFEQYLRQEWQRLERGKAQLSLILCKLNFNQTGNGASSNSVQQKYLPQVANAIKQAVKRPADLVARYADDMFAVILPYTNVAGAAHVAAAIRSEITALETALINPPMLPVKFSHQKPYPILTLGVSSMVPDSTSSPFTLVAAAERALYQAEIAECHRRTAEE